MFDSGGGQRQSTYKRGSNADLVRAMKRDMLEGYDHITFNPETGRLQLLTEILYQKRTSMFMRDTPSATFQEPETAKQVLKEIASVYHIFQVPFSVVQVHKCPYKSKGADHGEHEGWLHELAWSRAEKMKQELVKLGVPAEAVTAKAEIVSKTVIMQYCDFSMSFNHIAVNATSGVVSVDAGFEWEKRLYSRDHQDIPSAEFTNKEQVQEVLLEVIKLIKFYDCDMDVVIHKSYHKVFDDEHKQWLDELLDNRAERIKDELVDLGIKDSQVGSRVEQVEQDGAGIHFEIIHRTMGRTRTISGPKGPDHVLEVEGSGLNEFNGRYKPCGEACGKTKYRHERGSRETICFNHDNYWYMCYNHMPSKAIYKCRELAGLEQWKPTHSDHTGLVPIVKVVKLHDGVSTQRTDRTERTEVGLSDTGEDQSGSEASGSLSQGQSRSPVARQGSGGRLSVSFATDS
mmetsp:Transcript_55899/g.142194  ORF Transcript_55899/g.142194 Transcript_55899/m.142194 type:complete len:458 (+) Transcript_55899:2-1375(+)